MNSLLGSPFSTDEMDSAPQFPGEIQKSFQLIASVGNAKPGGFVSLSSENTLGR